MGVKNLQSFNRRLDAFQQGLPALALARQKKVAFLVLGATVEAPGGRLVTSSGVINMTPVDTGRLRGNWQVTADSPATGLLEGAFGGAGTPPTAAEVNRASGGMANAHPFGKIYVVNNLPYAVAANYGEGTHRVAHLMMERAVANVEAILGQIA
jgi:hypothetical protein